MKKIISIFCLLIILPLFAQKTTKFKEIDYKKPRSINRKGLLWAGEGRIIGFIKNPPNRMTIEFYPSNSETAIYTYDSPGMLFIYRSEFLQPGTYNLIIKAAGYQDKKISNIQLSAKTDCLLDLVFGKKVYSNW